MTEEVAKELMRTRENSVWPHMESFKNYGEKALILTEAEGCVCRDITGKTYIDGISGVSNVNAGYGRREIIDAMKRQLDKMPYNYLGYSASVPELELAGKLLAVLPRNMRRIFFGTGGAEANETAFKMARQYHFLRGEKGKFRIISRRISYHGGTIGAMSATGYFARKHPFEPMLLNFPKTEAAYDYRCPHGLDDHECGVEFALDLERVIRREGADSISAFVAEPVVGFAGAAIVPPPEYFPLVREICEKYDILLIMDEVITGFARTGRMFASEHWNIEPDIITMGKGITSGYSPLSAVAASDKVVDAYAKDDSVFMHGITYGGHPVSCAAGSAALEIYKKDNLSERANRLGEYLLGKLRAQDHRITGEVRGLGLLAGIELVRDKEGKKPFAEDEQVGKYVSTKALEKGVKIFGGKGAEPEDMGDLLIICPPLIMSEEQAAKIANVIDLSISEAEEAFQK